MIKGLYHGGAGMIARMTQHEAVSNNLANINTTGYKADRRIFRDTVCSELLLAGPAERGGMELDKFYTLHTDFSQGSFTETRNPLDLAIAGKGFFVIETGDAVGYTRNGNFTLNADGELVDSRGNRVMGDQGPIRVQGKAVSVTDSGELLVDGVNAGKLKLVDFEDLQTVKSNDHGYYAPESGVDPIPLESGKIMQGYLEGSNVNPIREMIQMIELNRSYEACQKSINAEDDALKLSVNEVAR